MWLNSLSNFQGGNDEISLSDLPPAFYKILIYYKRELQQHIADQVKALAYQQSKSILELCVDGKSIFWQIFAVPRGADSNPLNNTKIVFDPKVTTVIAELTTVLNTLNKIHEKPGQYNPTHFKPQPRHTQSPEEKAQAQLTPPSVSPSPSVTSGDDAE